MKGFVSKALVLVISVSLFCASCQQSPGPASSLSKGRLSAEDLPAGAGLPGEKKTRLIVAENMQLRQDLARRDDEIAKLNIRHEKEMKQQQEQLAKCLEAKEALEKQLRQNLKEQVESVLTTLVEDNAKLREEIKQLKAEIEKRKT
jgi:predicted  nucleic acid-binding Zn-ribbon protein